MADPFEQMTKDILDSDLGVTAIYSRVGFAGKTIRVAREDNVEMVGEHGQVLHLGTVFDIDRADVDQPAQGDTISIGTDTWTVQEIVELDQYLTRVATRG